MKVDFGFNMIPKQRGPDTGFVRDIMALWFIITDPKVPAKGQAFDFGYKAKFNGIGVFLYQFEEHLRITVA